VGLFFNDSPGRAVINFYAGAAIGAFLRVDNIGLFSLADCARRAFIETAAAFDTIFGNFVNQTRLL
jgi:hypothetical protein